jgi:endoglucanase
MWDLTPCEIRGDRLASRGCDDVVGCIALLGALNALVAKRVRTDVCFVFTRAEEVGFHGALALAKGGGLPRSVRVVSVETSKQIPPRACMGGGPVVRVGDRAAVFDSELTRFLSVVAVEFAKEEKSFRHQRCLMDGGICEATAFGESGYQASGLCIALGNYHNIGPRQCIAAEYVSLSDLHNLVRLITAAATWTPRYAELTDRLRHRLDDLHEAALRRLSPSFNLLS